jgi:hypothetical protein
MVFQTPPLLPQPQIIIDFFLKDFMVGAKQLIGTQILVKVLGWCETDLTDSIPPCVD